MPLAEPPRDASDPLVAARMSRARKHGTAPELALRKEMHRRGLRFRLQVPVPGNPRRSIDVALTRARVAVMVDGCFWHGCPQHEHRPRRNAVWWEWKIAMNQGRDAGTDALLVAAGWLPIRVWEHEDPSMAADRVEAAWRARTGRTHAPTD